jgi:hypothetical protein
MVREDEDGTLFFRGVLIALAASSLCWAALVFAGRYFLGA